MSTLTRQLTSAQARPILNLTWPARIGQAATLTFTQTVTLHTAPWYRAQYRYRLLRVRDQSASVYALTAARDGMAYPIPQDTLVVELHGAAVTIYAPGTQP